jgi:threonine/homoserine/homoserine lactone efflux protein
MIDLGWFWSGMGIGIAIAAPIGPINILCMQRTLVAGVAIGLASGLGAAAADTVFAAIAAFGVTAVTSFLTGHAFWLRLFGGAFLLWLGWRIFASAERVGAIDAASVAPPGFGLARAFATTFGLTLTNPTTIFSFMGVFAALERAFRPGEPVLAANLVAGVFAGSAAWWLVLSGGVALLRHRLNPGVLRGINRASGMIVAGFGVVVLVGAIGR